MRDLSTFFNPNSVAVVGASKNPDKVGHTVLKNIVESGFKGNIYPINPKEDVILNIPCYRSISDAEKIDLAVICVPAKIAVKSVQEAGENGVKNLIVITAGFKEVGGEGVELEKQLKEMCERYQMNMLGPNCLGFIDTATPLNASFASAKPAPGKIALVSQSGAIGSAIMDWSKPNNIGFSKIVSLGNKGHLNEADFMEATADDANTNVALYYIEDVVDGSHFMSAAEKSALRTPTLVLKSGKSEAGGRAASSHTGALAGNNKAYETAFQQSGIIEVYSLSELFELAMAFAPGRYPKADGVVIVTNAGGLGIITTDAVEQMGLTMATIDEKTKDILKGKLPDTASLINPIDIIGDAPPERYKAGLEAVIEDPNIGCIIVLLTPQAQTDPKGVANVIKDVYANTDKPILVSMLGGEAVDEGIQILREKEIPCYAFPEGVVRAAKGLYRFYGNKQKKERFEKLQYSFTADKERVAQLFRDVRADGRRTLLGNETYIVADAYGIPCPKTALAKTEEEAVTAALNVEYPVVMKVSSPEIIHKSDIGGVKLNVASEEEVRKNFNEIMNSAKRHLGGREDSLYGVEVQHMGEKGREFILGMSNDPNFGPMIMFGLGGIYVNLFGDVSFRLVEGLSREHISEMIRETKAYTLLKGYRGEKPADIEALENSILQLSQFLHDFGADVAELDINPLLVYEKGVMAVDVKITLS